MVKLAREISIHIVSEFGSEEMLRRLSDPFWFQAFGCVLGFDWHSSGVTTTVTGAVKEGIRGLEPDLGFYAGGGKGAASRNTPSEIAVACDRLSIDPRPLVYASRMSAKVDSAAVQDGYQLYHHAFFFTPSGGWCVVQQGMNDDNGMARRYHWLSAAVRSYVNEPHAAVCAEAEAPTLNLVANESEPRPFGLRGAVAAAAVGGPVRAEADARADDAEAACGAHRGRQPAVPAEDPVEDLRAGAGGFRDAARDAGGRRAHAARARARLGDHLRHARRARAIRRGSRSRTAARTGFRIPLTRGTYDKTVEVLRAAVNRAGIDRSERVQALKRLVKFGESRVRARLKETPE